MAILDTSAAPALDALSPSLIAVVGGKPLSGRRIFWNFVSSRRERIDQAAQARRAGEFPLVPGDEVEYIPLPDQ